MSCFWTHKWGLWGKVIERPFSRYNKDDDTLYVRYYQHRSCADCGKLQERRIVS
jgi:hypothetical protein